MEKVSAIIGQVEGFAPPSLACTWDNSGWQINLGNNRTEKILLCLTCTPDVVHQAKDEGCDLIISHHPLIFKGIGSNISVRKNYVHSMVVDAIKNDIQIYSAHTNLDSCKGGIADTMAQLLDLENISDLGIGEDSHLGRLGCCPGVPLHKFLDDVKIQFTQNLINVINPGFAPMNIKKVAVIPGSGGSLIPRLEGIDVVITGDIRYHNALDIQNVTVIDVGHFESERIILQVLKDLLDNNYVDVTIAKEKNAWITI